MAINISIVRKVIYAILTFVCFVVISELILGLSGFESYVQKRFFVVNHALDYPEVFLRNKKLFWKLKPNQTVTSKFFQGHSYRINSAGLHGYHKLYNQAIRKIAKQDAVLFVDAALEFDKYVNLYYDASLDPIHFNTKGHQILAQLIAAQITLSSLD